MLSSSTVRSSAAGASATSSTASFSASVTSGSAPVSAGSASAFEKLLSTSNSGGQSSSRVAEMFSSHPDTQARIERVAEKATADGYAKPAK